MHGWTVVICYFLPFLTIVTKKDGNRKIKKSGFIEIMTSAMAHFTLSHKLDYQGSHQI